ncbi:MAG: coproporphyrinogen-III oxidase family protein [Phycisphaerales bacterium]
MTGISLQVLNRSQPTARVQTDETSVGNYFIANYPPFGHWTPEAVSSMHDALGREPLHGARMGVYMHIPFCRKRCHFCYFRVYTDKNAREIKRYTDAMLREFRTYAESPVIAGRLPKFVYFGGGTPSYLSADQLRYLSGEMKAMLPWTEAEEVTLEAEPGTLNEKKVHAIRELGVTRLSLGIEHLDDRILELNGRAHRSEQAIRALGWAQDAGFPDINVDLIAGMLDETDEGWSQTVQRTIDLGPDTVTIYQMEVPYNTTIYKRMQEEGALIAPVATWGTKRRWVAEAFEAFERAGYTITSATTAVRDPDRSRFVYRNGLFDGSDVIASGVSAFGHVRGVNYQNEHNFDPYIDAVEERALPTYRAYALDDEERYIREFGLQLKGGEVAYAPFESKFGDHPLERFGSTLRRLEGEGYMLLGPDRVTLTREGLLRVDALLFDLFRPEHRQGRFA